MFDKNIHHEFWYTALNIHFHFYIQNMFPEYCLKFRHLNPLTIFSPMGKLNLLISGIIIHN